jgi:regulator of replication initiation timing
LEVLMRERSQRIDELNGRIERLREQNRRLDAENEHLVEMVRLPPVASGDPF